VEGAKAVEDESTTDTAKLRQQARDAREEKQGEAGRGQRGRQDGGKGGRGRGGQGDGDDGAGDGMVMFGGTKVVPKSRRLMSGAPEQCTKPRIRLRWEKDGEEVHASVEWNCVTVDANLLHELQVAQWRGDFVTVYRGPLSRYKAVLEPRKYRIRSRAFSQIYGAGRWSMESTLEGAFDTGTLSVHSGEGGRRGAL
jgi:hypothetical protein